MTKLSLTIVVVSYLLGSIPFGYLLVRIFRGQDVRNTGSGNIGATNVARTGSKGLAVATLFLDALKGYIAVAFAFWIAHAMFPTPTFIGGVVASDDLVFAGQTRFLLAALAAFCALLGHMFPVWLRFQGGKGVATAAGAFVALAPKCLLLSLLLFVIVFALTRYVSLGSIVAAASFPWLVLWLNPAERNTAPILLVITASSALVIARHKDNIRRLLAGTENRFH
ncbi:MAG: glycerol-3-phosphate 1-O-acyltransferase PlsY [Candidatus Korobacteraceae bacterium]